MKFLEKCFLFLFLINCNSFANAIFSYGPQICLQATISVLLELLQHFIPSVRFLLESNLCGNYCFSLESIWG